MAAAALVGVVTALAVRDPHVPGSWGTCIFVEVTGLPCPLCGGLRAGHDLAHGDLVAALSSNALAVALLPVAVVGWLVWVRRLVAGVPRELALPLPTLRAVLVVLGLLTLFGVLRWLPFASWLAP